MNIQKTIYHIYNVCEVNPVPHPSLTPPPPHRGSKLSLIAGLPLDSVSKSVFPSLHMQDPLAKS